MNVVSGQATGARRDNTLYLRRRTGQNPNQLPEKSGLNIALARTAYDTDRYYSSVCGDYLVGSWSVNLVANVVSEMPIAIVFIPDPSPSKGLDHSKESMPKLSNELKIVK